MNKSAFYTCMTGPDAGYVHDVRQLDQTHFDFYVFHDDYHQDFPGWRSINIEAGCPAQSFQYGHKQRYVKTMPHLYLSDYVYSVYLDPKWEITDAFLTLCQTLIDAKPNWLVPAHPDRNNFYEEILFPFSNGILSFDECTRLIDVLVAEKVKFNNFFTSLCGWMIRRHNLTNRKIGERWFELILQCYDNNVRDQIVFPFAVHNSRAIEKELTIAMLYESGVKLNYPNQKRIKQVDWQPRMQELIFYARQHSGIKIIGE